MTRILVIGRFRMKGRVILDNELKAKIYRNLVFWLSEKITDPEKVLRQIALDCNCTRDEVWEVYCEMTQAVFYK